MFSIAQRQSALHKRVGHFAPVHALMPQPPSAPPASRSQRKAQLHAAQTRWLDSVASASGLSLSEIARRAGMTPSTLTGLKTERRRGGTLHSLTISAVAQAAGVAAPPEIFGTPPDAPAPAGFREPEGAIYIAAGTDPLGPVVAATLADKPWLVAWTLKSRALEYEGYRPGDVLVIDLNAKPRNGDIVCAQVRDNQTGSAETIFRLFERPFLIVAGPEPASRKPAVVDEETVYVTGVMRWSFRRRPERSES